MSTLTTILTTTIKINIDYNDVNHNNNNIVNFDKNIDDNDENKKQ